MVEREKGAEKIVLRRLVHTKSKVQKGNAAAKAGHRHVVTDCDPAAPPR